MVTKEKIDEAAEVYEAHMGPGLFNYDGKFRKVGWGQPLAHEMHPKNFRLPRPLPVTLRHS